nr:MAG TPA: hypothetical protein [Caudoviricetes sp.]
MLAAQAKRLYTVFTPFGCVFRLANSPIAS